jgi:hypothetical protein
MSVSNSIKISYKTSYCHLETRNTNSYMQLTETKWRKTYTQKKAVDSQWGMERPDMELNINSRKKKCGRIKEIIIQKRNAREIFRLTVIRGKRPCCLKVTCSISNT